MANKRGRYSKADFFRILEESIIFGIPTLVVLLQGFQEDSSWHDLQGGLIALVISIVIYALKLLARGSK